MVTRVCHVYSFWFVCKKFVWKGTRPELKCKNVSFFSLGHEQVSRTVLVVSGGQGTISSSALCCRVKRFFHIGYFNAADCVAHHFLVSCSGSSECTADDPSERCHYCIWLCLFIVSMGSVPISKPTSAAIRHKLHAYLWPFKSFIHKGRGDGAIGGSPRFSRSCSVSSDMIIISLGWSWLPTGADNLTCCV